MNTDAAAVGAGAIGLFVTLFFGVISLGILFYFGVMMLIIQSNTRATRDAVAETNALLREMLKRGKPAP